MCIRDSCWADCLPGTWKRPQRRRREHHHRHTQQRLRGHGAGPGDYAGPVQHGLPLRPGRSAPAGLQPGGGQPDFGGRALRRDYQGVCHPPDARLQDPHGRGDLRDPGGEHRAGLQAGHGYQLRHNAGGRRPQSGRGPQAEGNGQRGL